MHYALVLARRWSVGTILTGLLSFMHDPQPTTGSITTTPEDKKRCAGRGEWGPGRGTGAMRAAYHLTQLCHN